MFKVHPYYFSMTKRAFDLSLSLFLLILLSPVLILISLLILLTAGWPIIFKQKRFGESKQPFTMYKFRTMYIGADKDQKKYLKKNKAPEPMFKIWEDPRFVGIGKWLSKSGLDELPQLINIFKGEMSFIGPRPLPVKEAKKLKPNWDFRYQVKPGVFSQWTISPDRHSSLNNWKKLDQLTLTRGGVICDLKLILTTLIKTFFKL